MTQPDKLSFHDALWKFIKDIKFAMLTHRHADGSLHAHPLTTQNRKLNAGDPLCFFVSKATEVGQRLRADGNVGLVYCDLKEDVWVSITGRATINEDLAKKKALFNPFAKAWFPGGADDPDLELVEIEIVDAEYWNVKESKATQLVKMAGAAISGKKPDMGIHREMDQPAEQESAGH